MQLFAEYKQNLPVSLTSDCDSFLYSLHLFPQLSVISPAFHGSFIICQSALVDRRGGKEEVFVNLARQKLRFRH